MSLQGTSILTPFPRPQVKVWQWAVVAPPDGGARQLRLAHSRSVAMADDVLAVRVSPDGKLIAVALLDSTVKVRVAEATHAYYFHTCNECHVGRAVKFLEGPRRRHVLVPVAVSSEFQR